jgi:hypothetical protein
MTLQATNFESLNLSTSALDAGMNPTFSSTGGLIEKT